MRRLALLAVLVSLSCGPNTSSIGETGDGGTGNGGGGTGSDAGNGGGSATDAGSNDDGGSGPSYSPESFFTQCNGAPTTLTGTILAPNGVDPVAKGEIAVWATAPAALPRGVLCEACDPLASTGALASATAGADGKFTLSLDALKKQGSYVITVRKARFRRATTVNVTACGATAIPATASKLPSSAAEGDVPKIAISSGNKDHLEKVVTAMGVTDYDCVKGLPSTSTSDTCKTGITLGALLSNLDLMKTYGLIFIACAPQDAYEPALSSDVAAQNLKTWVGLGGKLVVTDDSYDFVEQSFPDAIDFAGTAAPAGTAQPANTGEVGTATTSVTGTVTDPSLAAWLNLFPNTIDSNDGVTISGFLSNWAVQRGVGAETRAVVHGVAPSSLGNVDVPLTSSFEVNKCGRVIFSSYHTNTSTGGGLLPQERILEYLLFEVSTCTGPIN